MTDSKGLKTFELYNGIVSEVDWKMGSIFMSANLNGSETTQTYYFDKKEGAIYTKSLNIQNAKRKLLK